MMSLNHEHICKFMGLCIDGPIQAVTEYCPRGSLQDFLEGDMYGKLDDMFRYRVYYYWGINSALPTTFCCYFRVCFFRNSVILDIAKGMLYLHKSPIQTHGNLKASNCLLDGRLVVKLTDFALSSFRQRHRRDSVIGYSHYKGMCRLCT